MVHGVKCKGTRLLIEKENEIDLYVSIFNCANIGLFHDHFETPTLPAVIMTPPPCQLLQCHFPHALCQLFLLPLRGEGADYYFS